jgi:hypothetical protein
LIAHFGIGPPNRTTELSRSHYLLIFYLRQLPAIVLLRHQAPDDIQVDT